MQNNFYGDCILASICTVMQGSFQQHIISCCSMFVHVMVLLYQIYQCLWPRTKGYSSNVLLGMPHNLLVLGKLSVFLTLHLVAWFEEGKGV